MIILQREFFILKLFITDFIHLFRPDDCWLLFLYSIFMSLLDDVNIYT